VELLVRLCPTAIFQKMDTSMGLSSIASLSLGLSMSMTGTPGGAMMMRNLGVSAGPLQRLGGVGPSLHRSNNSLSQSPRPPRGPDSAKPDTDTPTRTAAAPPPPPNNDQVSINICVLFSVFACVPCAFLWYFVVLDMDHWSDAVK